MKYNFKELANEFLENRNDLLIIIRSYRLIGKIDLNINIVNIK